MKGTMRTFRLSTFPLVVFVCCSLAQAAGFGVEIKVADGKAAQSDKSKPPAAAGSGGSSRDNRNVCRCAALGHLER